MDAFTLVYTLIRRLKLKDKRAKSYNINKKQNYTNCQRNTVNKKRRKRYTYIATATKNYIKQHSTVFGDSSMQLGGKNYIKLRVARMQRKLLQAHQNNKKTKPYIYKT